MEKIYKDMAFSYVYQERDKGLLLLRKKYGVKTRGDVKKLLEKKLKGDYRTESIDWAVEKIKCGKGCYKTLSSLVELSGNDKKELKKLHEKMKGQECYERSIDDVLKHL
ncbi:MAG: hypothetical protein N4A47_06165 [Clostridia bacterium]|jgi:hypothetical protein|nr:hypothetical protein [Clostridia bacterium]